MKGAAALSLAGAVAAVGTGASPQRPENAKDPLDDDTLLEQPSAAVGQSAQQLPDPLYPALGRATRAPASASGARGGLGPGAMHAASPAEGPPAEEASPGLWQRLTQPLWRLGGARDALVPPVEVPLPMDKLTCKLGSARWVPRVLSALGFFKSCKP